MFYSCYGPTYQILCKFDGRGQRYHVSLNLVPRVNKLRAVRRRCYTFTNDGRPVGDTTSAGNEVVFPCVWHFKDHVLVCKIHKISKQLFEICSTLVTVLHTKFCVIQMTVCKDMMSPRIWHFKNHVLVCKIHNILRNLFKIFSTLVSVLHTKCCVNRKTVAKEIQFSPVLGISRTHSGL